MTLTVLDPCTGHRVTVDVPVKPQAMRRIRRWVLREQDWVEMNKKPGTSRA